jgi:hypothetical protein
VNRRPRCKHPLGHTGPCLYARAPRPLEWPAGLEAAAPSKPSRPCSGPEVAPPPHAVARVGQSSGLTGCKRHEQSWLLLAGEPGKKQRPAGRPPCAWLAGSCQRCSGTEPGRRSGCTVWYKSSRGTLCGECGTWGSGPKYTLYIGSVRDSNNRNQSMPSARQEPALPALAIAVAIAATCACSGVPLSCAPPALLRRPSSAPSDARGRPRPTTRATRHTVKHPPPASSTLQL